MTLSQARRRFPFIPAEVVDWAVQNIDNPGALERCLRQLDQSRRLRLKYANE